QPGTAMTAHGDQVRCHCGAGPFFASGAPRDQRPGDADPALKQIYLCVTQPTANSEEAKWGTLTVCSSAGSAAVLPGRQGRVAAVLCKTGAGLGADRLKSAGAIQ